MFDGIPDNYKPQTAADPEEGWRYARRQSARRPPELLTRDHVARCINRRGQRPDADRRTAASSSTSRGSRKRSPTRKGIKRAPSMYHQFKTLADLDITQEAMEELARPCTTSWAAFA